MKLLLLDSNSILNRAFYGIRLLSTKSGVYTNAVVGFLNIFLKLKEELKPDVIVAAFDVSRKTFRNDLYEQYKAHRKGMPDELRAQLPLMKEILYLMGISVLEKEGYEADDLIGTMSKLCTDSDTVCYIATGDRDSFQLISDHVTVRLASTKGGSPLSELYDVQKIIDTYGVTPDRLIDVKAIMGDTSDNIPGVAGIGEKGALQLISKYQTLDYIYDHLEELEISEGMREKLRASKEMAFVSRKLATIDCQVPVSCTLSDYRQTAIDEGGLRKKLSELEMFSMITKLGLSSSSPPAAPDVQESSGQLSFDTAVQAPVAKRTLPLLEDEKAVLKRIASEKVCFFLAQCNGSDFQKAVFSFEDCFGVLSDTQTFLQLLQNKEIAKYTFDAKPCYRFAFASSSGLENLQFDGILAAYLLNSSSSAYDLFRLAEIYHIEDIPEALGEESLSSAVYILRAIMPILQEELKSSGAQKLYEEIELPLCEVLAHMEHVGILLDKDRLFSFSQELEKSLQTLKDRIFEIAEGEFNLNSPKQLGEVLFDKLSLPHAKKTKTGYSTNADTLEFLKDKHPIVAHILEYRKIQKLLSTYASGLLPLISDDGRIHTTFRQTETRTGRISSVEPNLQNIPVRTELGSRMRKYFIAPFGSVLLDADYSQIELRVLAHASADEKMITAFRDGADIHRITAAEVFHLPLEFVSPELRSRAKAVNFGIVYGIGAFSLSQDIGVSVAEASQYIKSYFAIYSKVKEFLDSVVKEAEETGYVTTLFGRRRYIPEIKNTNKITKALGQRIAMNTPVQGTAADIIKIAMIRVYRRLKEEKLSARLILQVHDELIVEAPEAERQAAAKILKEEMENAVSFSVAMRADVSEGENWYDAKG